jgi:hypothetical protein
MLQIVVTYLALETNESINTIDKNAGYQLEGLFVFFGGWICTDQQTIPYHPIAFSGGATILNKK